MGVSTKRGLNIDPKMLGLIMRTPQKEPPSLWKPSNLGVLFVGVRSGRTPPSCGEPLSPVCCNSELSDGGPKDHQHRRIHILALRPKTRGIQEFIACMWVFWASNRVRMGFPGNPSWPRMHRESAACVFRSPSPALFDCLRSEFQVLLTQEYEKIANENAQLRQENAVQKAAAKSPRSNLQLAV